MIPKFDATVTNGKLYMRNAALFASYLSTLVGDVGVTVGKKAKGRTNPQNSWYWAAIVGIPAREIGYVPQEMHDAFKLMFLRREEPGKPVTIGSTTTMTTAEFSDYCEACRRWCAEQGYAIPDPDGYE